MPSANPHAANPTIDVQGLVKSYGALRAVAGVNLRVEAGSIFGFLGPNGAGKTTTIRILLGLLRATDGSARVLGLDAWRQSTEIRRHVGYLPGDVRFYDWMRGRTFLSFCNRARGGGCEAEIRRLCDRFHLDLSRRIRDYSRGMKQKLGVIQALMHRPEVLILDEPTTALDPLVQQTVYEELRAAAGEGRTVLFSSHTLSEVELLCDRVAIIRAGRIIEDSSISELRQRALRRVELRLKQGALREDLIPHGFTPRPSVDGVICGSWAGSVEELLRWLSTLDVADVTIGAPDLEDLFATYYEEAPRA
ncbi:MAG: ABC transporter ATP-binding protein [Phycisphaerae bacterium]|nr:MAG: ABC transporter ATP-binding protein [Planctomycetia bacterium]RIK68423.1 MAG: ABC transporter [Planctomycetota bacterium]GJQ27862.1 MAG: ABC transporter ATP-binding protein [Phycisphaerae bacterium]